MATQALGISSVLSHYKLLEKIGEGGMGAVFRAHDERLDREVAIKVLPPHVLADDATRRRFRHEALALSKLNHPNIATIHDFDTDQNLDFLVMEYIPGTTLSERVRVGPLSAREVLGVASQMLEGLAAAHAHGVIHRDLKPGNIRQTPDGRIKILDFGIAEVIRAGPAEATVSVTDAGMSGTLPYMAPEQIRGDPCDERTDFYAVGAVLFELVTGRQLFPETQTGKLIDSILHKEPEHPAALTSGTPLELERIILKALSKDPSERFRDADEFLAAIRNLTGEQIVSFSPTVQVRLRPVADILNRHRRAVAVMVMALTFLVAGLWYLRTPALAFSARDFIVISDFDNQTGDPVFDKSLTTAFNTSLGQSAFANIASRQRLSDALKRMKRPPSDKIDESAAIEIGQREGFNVLVVPSIAAVGDTYSISARIHDVQKSRDYRSEVVSANGKKEVLPAIDKLAARIRRDLGESSQAIAQTSKPLAQVTTSSLDALRQYSLGLEKRVSGRVEEARTYFENALRIDPEFTSARASLGALLIDMASLQVPGFDFQEGKRLLDEASKNLSGLTERERYGVLAFRASKVDRNLEAANASYKALLAHYPDDIATHNNLAWNYAQMGRFNEAIAEARTVIRLDPSFVLAQLNLGYVYLYRLGDIPNAIEVYNGILKVDPGNGWAYDGLGWASLGRGDFASAQADFEKAVSTDPRQLLSRYRLAHSYRLQGKYTSAVDVIKEIQRTFPSELSAIYDEAMNRDRMGQREQAVRLWEQYCTRAEAEARKSKPPPNRLNIAAAMAHMGRTKQAAAILNAALKRNPKSGFDAATVLALLGQKDKAVEQLRYSLSVGYDNYIWIKIHPDLDSLHGYPPFEDLLKEKLKT